MVKVTPAMVKELREKTGAGMLDCKKALEETQGDIEAAITYLREKGIAKAEKKASRVAAEGLCNVVSNDTDAVLFEINSETDFVAKNAIFLDLVAKIGDALLNSSVQNTEEALALEVDGQTIEIILKEATATIGEKISMRRVTRVTKNASQSFGSYKHMGGRIVSLTVVEGQNDEVAKDIAMHVAAINPKYLSQNDISSEVVEHERSILLAEALNENASAAKPKPENIIEKMVQGRLNKYLQEICLLNQPFVKNPELTVEAYVKSKGSKVVSYKRLEVGEGIEKEVVDFAAEVMSQVR